MSMKEYAENICGLVLTHAEAKKYLSEYEDDSIYDICYGLDDMFWCVVIGSEHTGEIFNLYSSDKFKYYSDGDIVMMIGCDRQKCIIGCAYESIDEIVEEMKKKVGVYLPDDFDYVGHLGEFIGTYWG